MLERAETSLTGLLADRTLDLANTPPLVVAECLRDMAAAGAVLEQARMLVREGLLRLRFFFAFLANIEIFFLQLAIFFFPHPLAQHRDISEDNVLVRRRGAGWQLVLCDFGCALTFPADVSADADTICESMAKRGCVRNYVSAQGGQGYFCLLSLQ